MGEYVALIVSWILTTVGCFVVVIRDERRLEAAERERAWPAVSRDAAIIAFSQIAVVVHFWKTRRWGLKGLGLGVLYALVATLPALAADFVLGLIFPELQ